MRLYSVLIVLALLVFCQSCNSREKLAGVQFNPYLGAVKDILPQQVGDYRLVQSTPLNEIEQELVNPRDGVGAIYNSSKNHTVQHLLVSYQSAAEANKELDAAEKRYQDAHLNLRREEVKDEKGQSVGRKLVVNDGKTEAMNWTHGSLYCTAVSYTGYSSDFVRNLPY